MTTKEIIELDYRSEANREKIQKALRAIKPLSKKSSEVKIEDLEKALFILAKKYKIKINNIHADCGANDKYIVWSALISDDTFVYAMSMYELLCKCTIKIYSLAKRREGNV